jgi:hypothetical protein
VTVGIILPVDNRVDLSNSGVVLQAIFTILLCYAQPEEEASKNENF